jgi:hypothetical protein
MYYIQIKNDTDNKVLDQFALTRQDEFSEKLQELVSNIPQIEGKNPNFWAKRDSSKIKRQNLTKARIFGKFHYVARYTDKHKTIAVYVRYAQ